MGKISAVLFLVGVLLFPFALVATIHTGDPVWFYGVWAVWLLAVKVGVLGILGSLSR